MKKSIGDICEILNGYSFKSEKYTNEGVRVIRIANVQNGYIEDATPQFYPNSEIDSFKDFLLQKNDLLISLTGNVGRVALLDEKFLPAALNQRVACLRPKSTAVSTKFLFYALSSERFIQDCEDSARGVAQKNMSTEWLKKYFINLPDVGTQLYWIKTLDAVTELIKKRKLQLRYLDQLASSRFIEMFGDPEDNPRKWCKLPLKDSVVRIENGKSPVCENFSRVGTNPAVLKLSSISSGYFKATENKALQDGVPFLSVYEVHAGDLLISRKNTLDLVGKACYVFETPEFLQLPDLIFRLDLTHRIHGIFLCFLFNHPSFRPKVQALAGGSAGSMPNISKSRLENLIILVPPIELQNEFAAFVEQLDKSKVICNKMHKMVEFSLFRV